MIRPHPHAISLLASLVILLAAATGARAQRPIDRGGVPYQREEVFEFTEAPTFRKVRMDRYEIEFACKGACDVTVAIQDAGGQTIRHLISGVLGPNAPEPLAKNSLRQQLSWDGKNDVGRFVDRPETCRVHVALGLKPTFDKVLLWHPKALSNNIYGICCDQDGVYVMDSLIPFESWPGIINRVLVYDHRGEYVRQIMPQPRDKVSPEQYPLINEAMRTSVHGVGWLKGNNPSGKVAEGPPYSLQLSTGQTIVTPNSVGTFFRPLTPNSLSVADGILTAVVETSGAPPKGTELQLFRIKTDGSRPAEGFYSQALGRRPGTGPNWLAASTDRKWMYVSGLGARDIALPYGGATWRHMMRDRKEVCDHVVHRLPYDLSKPAEVFLGENNTPGNDANHFRFPEGVACDQEGRIYVADNGNNRVQVFSAEGKFLKTIPVADPYQAAIHPQTGAVYVLSYAPKLTQVTVTKFKGLSDAKPQATLTLRNIRPSHAALMPPFCLDPWAKEPTVWLLAPDDHVQAWTDKGDRFELLRDFAADLEKEWTGPTHPGGKDRSHPFANDNYCAIVADPYRPRLCLHPGWQQELPLHGYSEIRNPWVNTDTGEIFLAPRVTTFGQDGLGYVRKGNVIYRIDPQTGEAVAFDYGEGSEGKLRYKYAAGSGRDLAVGVDGKVAFVDRWPPVPGLQLKNLTSATKAIPNYMRPKEAQTNDGTATDLEQYQIRQKYPGRIYGHSCAVLLYDSTGQMKNNDLIEGLPRPASGSGLRMDFKGNVYVAVCFPKVVDGVEILGNSLCKFGPKGGRIIVNGPGVPVPLKDPPKRPPDFIPRLDMLGDGPPDFGPNGEFGAGDKAWAEGMHWSFGSYNSFGRGACICHQARFDLDFFARAYVPEAHRQSVAILDTNGNFILRLGAYGNADDRGPEIRVSHCRYVSVSEKRLYLNDIPNRRVLSIDLRYEREATARMQ